MSLGLVKQDYADATIYFDVTEVKTVVRWLIGLKLLPEGSRINLPIVKPDGCNAYCYTIEQVSAMVQLCRRQPELKWLADVLVGLACTGLRIGELASLRWSDIDLQSEVIHLTDERWSYRRKKLGNARHVKGKRSRAIPLHPDLKKVLERIPKSKDGLVFHGRRGGKLNDGRVRDSLRKRVIDKLKSEFPKPASELGFEDGLLHSFRHYFCSESFRNGATEAELLEWLGHRDSKMVAHYRHLRADDSKRRMQQMKFLDMQEPSPSDR